MPPRRRSKSLAGTHLSQDERTGVYVWRRTDPRTGKRAKRSTGTKVLELALRKAAEFEDAHERREVGLKDYSCWKAELRPLAEQYIEARKEDVSAKTLAQTKTHVTRALDELGLRTAADLDDVGRLHDRLILLGRGKGLTGLTLRRCYQDPLKWFAAWLAANRRHLDRNPLASWERIKSTPDPDVEGRHAFLPDDVARAFLALELLDRAHGRRFPQRPIFLTFLITAPRVTALISRTVADLRVDASRLDFGPDVGNKRRGAGALDSATCSELQAYVGDRKEGPLFLSPDGKRLTKERTLDRWREAFGLGLVDRLWPRDEPKDYDAVYFTNLTLLSGRVRVSRGGNPEVVLGETLKERETLARRIARAVERLRVDWHDRMSSVDVHAFRMTHRSWAEASGVPPVLIDKQLGHSSGRAAGSLDVLRAVAGSATGRKHYLDVGSSLFDATRSAQAVRELFDRALEAARKQVDTVLVVPISVPMALNAGT